jgi:hypothetical protein
MCQYANVVIYQWMMADQVFIDLPWTIFYELWTSTVANLE